MQIIKFYPKNRRVSKHTHVRVLRGQWDIKFIRSELYGEDSDENYFIIISILKLIKTILKLQDKFRKDDGNDMAADVA